jgi:hypothetical protein
MWVTWLVRPLAAVISFTARRMLWPMFGGASKITTPSGVVRNADM